MLRRKLPPQLAGIKSGEHRRSRNAVRGIVEKDKNKIFLASLLDPLTATILTIDETRQMVDETIHAEKKYLKGYK